MGAAQGKSSNDRNLLQSLNMIATQYIFKQNFQDLKKLRDAKYCNNLVVLTSKIINQNFNSKEIEFLATKMKKGIKVNELDNQKLVYLQNTNLQNLDVKNTSKKQRMCIGIAKFYVKIAHIFACILTSINPMYSYTDQFGNKQQVGIQEKSKLPSSIKLTLQKTGICASRIQALINNRDFSDLSTIHVKPKYCNINHFKDGNLKNLSDEPGISELEELYKDEYNYETGKYTSMSSDMKIKYKLDVQKMYKAFTGEKTIPPEIQKFSDIQLRNFKAKDSCKKGTPFTKEYTATSSNDNFPLYQEYAKHIKQMKKNSSSKQLELMKILDEIFIYQIINQKKKITIQPNLNFEKLQELVDKTRKLIVEMFIQCEEDYIKGLELYEAIVQKQMLVLTQNQIKSLEQKMVNTISETKPI